MKNEAHQVMKGRLIVHLHGSKRQHGSRDGDRLVGGRCNRDCDLAYQNADEPRFLDYNQEYNPEPLYEANPFRSSDHDPVLIGIRNQSAIE